MKQQCWKIIYFLLKFVINHFNHQKHPTSINISYCCLSIIATQINSHRSFQSSIRNDLEWVKLCFYFHLYFIQFNHVTCFANIYYSDTIFYADICLFLVPLRRSRISKHKFLFFIRLPWHFLRQFQCIHPKQNKNNNNNRNIKKTKIRNNSNKKRVHLILKRLTRQSICPYNVCYWDVHSYTSI